MSKEVVLNTHIEKTAGISLANWFVKVHGGDRVLVYSALTDTLQRASELPTMNPRVDRIKTILSLTPLISIAARMAIAHRSSPSRTHIRPDDLPPDVDVIHGHFGPTRFSESLDDPFRSVVFREPLDRAVSHYIYWLRRKGVANQRIVIPFDDRMTFKDFVMLPQLANFQSRVVGEMNADDFDLVGTTENMTTFTGEYFRKRGLEGNPPKFPSLNRTILMPSLKRLGVDGSFRKAFASQNAQDYELYTRAIELTPHSS